MFIIVCLILFYFSCDFWVKAMGSEANWERLVRATLRRERLGAGVYGQPVSGIAGNVPSSLANNLHIDEILRAADEILEEDPNVSRICKPQTFSCFFLFKCKWLG